MSTSATPSGGEGWLDEGTRAAHVLDAVSAAVVVGRDAEAAAWVALGLARAQATHRRVAIADLVGEVAPLQSLVDPDGDPHGISDSFLYGVSLNRIAHPADASGNLFVLPSGSEAVATDDVFRSDRWRRLATGFREVGALLLLVAQADTPGLDALVASVEGSIIVGEAGGALADAAPPLAVLAPTRRRPSRATPAAETAQQGAGMRTPRTAAPPIVGVVPNDPRAARPAWQRWLAIAILALCLAGAVAFWVLPNRTSTRGDVPTRADTTRRDTAATRAPSATRAPNAPNVPNAPSVDTSAGRTPPPLTALVVANPADSNAALRYSVYVSASNTPEGALTALDGRTSAALSVVALTPVLQDGATDYRLLVGAFAARASADSLLGALQRRGVLGAESGVVRRTPYALLVQDRVPLAEVRPRIEALATQNVSVYPLSRGDGTAALYAGAFEQPEQAAWLARALQAAGITPTLVFRTGRSL